MLSKLPMTGYLGGPGGRSLIPFLHRIIPATMTATARERSWVVLPNDCVDDMAALVVVVGFSLSFLAGMRPRKAFYEVH
jgi:hypothetical protein